MTLLQKKEKFNKQFPNGRSIDKIFLENFPQLKRKSIRLTPLRDLISKLFSFTKFREILTELLRREWLDRERLLFLTKVDLHKFYLLISVVFQNFW